MEGPVVVHTHHAFAHALLAVAYLATAAIFTVDGIFLHAFCTLAIALIYGALYLFT